MQVKLIVATSGGNKRSTSHSIVPCFPVLSGYFLISITTFVINTNYVVLSINLVYNKLLDETHLWSFSFKWCVAVAFNLCPSSAVYSVSKHSGLQNNMGLCVNTNTRQRANLRQSMCAGVCVCAHSAIHYRNLVSEWQNLQWVTKVNTNYRNMFGAWVSLFSVGQLSIC
jgi:hypothetical protein